MKYLFIGLIRLYQLIVSPHFPSRCRYHPTCSQYAVDAFRKHGSLKGLWLSTKRILKCHPLSSGGHDPVPDASEYSNSSTQFTNTKT